MSNLTGLCIEKRTTTLQLFCKTFCAYHCSVATANADIRNLPRWFHRRVVLGSFLIWICPVIGEYSLDQLWCLGVRQRWRRRLGPTQVQNLSTKSINSLYRLWKDETVGAPGENKWGKANKTKMRGKSTTPSQKTWTCDSKEEKLYKGKQETLTLFDLRLAKSLSIGLGGVVPSPCRASNMYCNEFRTQIFSASSISKSKFVTYCTHSSAI